MDLRRLVQTAINAVPSGVKGTATVTRTRPGTLDPLTDTRTGDVEESFTAPMVMVTPSGDRFAPMPRVDAEREVVIADADCDFAPATGDAVIVTTDPHVWRVVAPLAVAPSGGPAIVHRVRVKAVGTRVIAAAIESALAVGAQLVASTRYALTGDQGVQAGVSVTGATTYAVAGAMGVSGGAAVSGDNGVPLSYKPGDPITATRGSSATFSASVP